MPVPRTSADEMRLFFSAMLAQKKRSVAMKKKNVRYPEADSLSMEAMRLEQRRLRREVSTLRKDLQEFKTIYPLIENIIETSVRITRTRKIG